MCFQMINVIATIQLKYFLCLKTTELPAYFNKQEMKHFFFSLFGMSLNVTQQLIGQFFICPGKISRFN